MRHKKTLEHYYVSPRQRERDNLGLLPIKIAWPEVVEERRDRACPPPPDLLVMGGMSDLSNDSSDDSLCYSNK